MNAIENKNTTTTRKPYEPMPSEMELVTVADSLQRGIPLPPAIVARIPRPDGAEALLLIDGLQRTTALRNIIEVCGFLPRLPCFASNVPRKSFPKTKWNILGYPTINNQTSKGE